MVQFRMTIRYDSKPDDLGDFTDWYYHNMPQGQKAINLFRLIMLSWFVIVYLYCAWRHLPLFLIVFLAVGGVIAQLNIPRSLMRHSRRQSIKVHSSPASAHLFGPKTVEIDAKGVLSISQSTTAMYQWDSVVQIAHTATHIFLLVGPIQALVIPRASVTDGDFDAFVSEAIRLKAASQVAQPAPIPAM